MTEPEWMKKTENARLVSSPAPTVELVDHYTTSGYIYYLGADGVVYMQCTLELPSRWYKFVPKEVRE